MYHPHIQLELIHSAISAVFSACLSLISNPRCKFQFNFVNKQYNNNNETTHIAKLTTLLQISKYYLLSIYEHDKSNHDIKIKTKEKEAYLVVKVQERSPPLRKTCVQPVSVLPSLRYAHTRGHQYAIHTLHASSNYLEL